MVLLLATDLAAFDHHEGAITLIANAVNWNGTDEHVDEAYDDAVARLDKMTEALAAPAPSTVSVFDQPDPEFRRQRTTDDFGADVRSLVGEIEAGEAFQIVLSQRFEMDYDGSPLDLYRMLRASNPSPYMYLLHIPDGDGGTAFSIVGSSPEALVTVTDGVATTPPDRRHPLARRHRGGRHAAREGPARRREGERRAPHARRPRPQRSRPRLRARAPSRCSDYRHIERYSHVMHLVSTVSRARWPTAKPPSTRSPRASRPAPCPGRRRCGRWS